MKNIFYILLLLPTIIFAQYPSNSGQKITLGEQTTADGLVWRGIRADTTSKIVPFSDTSAYIILDTVEKTLWLYKAGQIPKWQQVGGSTLDTATMLLPYWRSGRFSGVLPVANGGTGATTLAAAGINTGSGTANYLPKYTAATTFGNSLIYDNGSSVGIGTASPTAGFQLQVTGTNSRLAILNSSSASTSNYSQMAFGHGGGAGQYAEFYRQNDTKRFSIFNGGGDIFFSTNYTSDFRYDFFVESDNGNVGIGTASPTARLQVKGSGISTGETFKLENSVGTNLLTVLDNGSMTLNTPLAVANGGTGQTTPTAALNALLPAQSQSTTIGATLKSNGTNSYWDNFSAAGTVQDQSGNFYNTVAIGTQVWFKENLRTKKYRSGALIPVKTNNDTSTLVGQMYYYLNDSLTNYSIYGAMYNWKATQNSDSLCPIGWHVPTDAEWTTLTTFLGGESAAGGKMKATGTTYWNSPNTGATNESGFSGLPGGYRNNAGSFFSIMDYAFFWSATDGASTSAWCRLLFNNNNSVVSDNSAGNKVIGASVRCLKN